MASKKSKGSFVFYESFYNAVNMIDDINIKVQAYDLIVQYGLYGKKVNTNEPILKVVFEMIKPLIESTDKRYITSVENGKKGGAPKGNKNAVKKQPKKQPKTTEQTRGCFQNNLNDNDNDNDNVNDNDNENEKDKNNVVFSLSQKDYEKFKNSFQNKAIKEQEKVPQNFDIDKLIKAVKESQFLSSNDNLSFAWLVERYTDVINGKYKDFIKQEQAKQKGVVITHNYTQDELENYFTDLDSIKF